MEILELKNTKKQNEGTDEFNVKLDAEMQLKSVNWKIS